MPGGQAEAYLKPCQTSRMELFAKIVLLFLKGLHQRNLVLKDWEHIVNKRSNNENENELYFYQIFSSIFLFGHIYFSKKESILNSKILI